jgi:hypothetical protein
MPQSRQASLMFSRGAAGPETGVAYTRALEIAEGLDDAEYRLRALWGLWACHSMELNRAIREIFTLIREPALVRFFGIALPTNAIDNNRLDRKKPHTSRVATAPDAERRSDAADGCGTSLRTPRI